MQKSALQYGEIIFQSKVIPLFLPKCSKLHSFYIIMVYISIPFRDSYLNIEKEFHYTVKDFFAQLFKGNNISKIK